MQEFYQSNLLQSLGWAIADSFWQMSLLWMVYQVILVPVFKTKPVFKHIGALSLLLAGTGWFMVSFVGRMVSHEYMINAPVKAATESVSINSYLSSLLPYFSFAYLAVLMLLFIRLAFSIMSMQKLRLELKPAIEWQHVVNRLTVRMGISRDIFIYISDYINVPSTIGHLKPVILLPIASLNQLTVEQVEAVIMHEMAHIRRNDYLVNLVVAFVETVLFFNPFAHLLSKAIRKECELCCDDDVLNQKQDPQQYAQALLLLERCKTKPVLAMAATGRQGLLLGRVKRILNLPDQEVKYRHKLIALVAVAGLVILTGVLAPAKTSLLDVKKDVTMLTETKKRIDVLPYSSGIQLPYADRFQSNKTTKAKQKALKPGLPTTPNLPSAVASKQGPKAPLAPLPPPPPAAEIEELASIWNFPSTGEISEINIGKKSQAPDPRDRRHPGILINTDLAMIEQSANIARNNVDLDKLIRLEKDRSAMALPNGKTMYEEGELIQPLVEDYIKTTPELQFRKIRTETMKGYSATPKPIIHAVPGQKGMTIRIIGDENQIEITVKDKK